MTLRADYAIIVFSIILLAGSMYLAGLSFQMAETPARMETLNYATYLFATSIGLLIFMAAIALVKKKVFKPEE